MARPGLKKLWVEDFFPWLAIIIRRRTLRGREGGDPLYVILRIYDLPNLSRLSE